MRMSVSKWIAAVALVLSAGGAARAEPVRVDYTIDSKAWRKTRAPSRC